MRKPQPISNYLFGLKWIYDNPLFYFGEVPDTDTDVPLNRIENALGHFLHSNHTTDGTLTGIRRVKRSKS